MKAGQKNPNAGLTKTLTLFLFLDRKQWTVHGIWPTKNFTIGPLFCNHSAHFDFNALSPILEDLKLHWTNVR